MSKKKIFSSDNPFNAFMTKLFDLMWINVMWLICCIPVITIGASTSAMYYLTLKMIRDEEGAITKSFFKQFAANFKKSIPMTLIMIAMVAVLVADFHLLSAAGNDSIASIMYGGCIALAVIALGYFSTLWPVYARFENTVKNTLANAGKIAIANIPKTLVIMVINAVPAVWFMVSPETFVYVWWLWAVIAVSGSAYLNSMLIIGIFDRLSGDKDENDTAENEEQQN
ncbi:MAG: YesL family protein [Butyrivibrio sp.]